jgi:hypothetical protein
MWPSFFEILDPGVTQFPMEQRHPLFDLRVATFLAGLPALPWCQEKNIMRAAGRGLLPDAVRLRPKAVVRCNAILDKFQGCGPEWWAKHLDPVPELARYVNPDALPTGSGSSRGWEELRLMSLNYWLQLGRKSPKIAGRLCVSKQGQV